MKNFYYGVCSRYSRSTYIMRYTNRTGKKLQRRDKHHPDAGFFAATGRSFPIVFQFFFLCSYTGSQNYCRVLRSQIENSTGFNFAIADAEKDGGISLLIDPAMEINEEGYRLDVTPQGVKIQAKTPQGVFYGMQSFCNCCLPKWRVLQWSKTSNGVHLA